MCSICICVRLQDEEKEEMKEVQEMKRIHQRFSKKRQMEREARAHRRQQEYEKFFGTAPKPDSTEQSNLWIGFLLIAIN